MELTKQKIGFPLLVFNNVKIRLTAPLIPNAFEKAVVKVIGHSADDETLRNLPLRNVFADILGVPNPDAMLTKTLDELTVKNIIHCDSYGDAMTAEPLYHFSLTERGKRLRTENILHGVIQERFADYQYDPLTEELLDTEAVGWGTKKPESAIDETPFLQTFPTMKIQQRWKRNQDFQFTPQTQIDSVERTAEPAVLWKTQDVTFNTEKGTLKIQSLNSKVADYLNALSATTLSETVLQKLFGNMSEWENFPLMNSEVFEKLPKTDWIPATDRLDDFAGETLITVFNPEWNGYKFGHNRLVFDNELDRLIRMGGNNNGTRFITVRGGYPFGDETICVTDKYELSGFRVAVRFNGEQLELPIIVRRNVNDFISQFLTDAVDLADESNERYENGEWGDYLRDWQDLLNSFWKNF